MDWIHNEELSQDDKAEVLEEMIEDLLKEGLHISQAVKVIMCEYNATKKEILDILKLTRIGKLHIVCIVNSPDKNGSCEIRESIFTHIVHNVINKMIKDLIINHNLNIMQAAVSVSYFLGGNDEISHSIVGQSIRAGLKNSRYKYIFKKELKKINVRIEE